MRTPRPLCFLGLLLATLAPVSGAAAQQLASAAEAPGASSRVALVVISGKPGDLVTVGIPVPAAEREAVDYRVRPGEAVQLVGPSEGSVSGGAGSHLMLTYLVSSGARAGEQSAGQVSFHTEGGLVTAQLLLDVPRVRRRVLQFDDRVTALKEGHRAEVPFTVLNEGNLTDTLRIGVSVPSGWRYELEPEEVVLEPGQEVTGVLSIQPDLAAGGSQRVDAWLDGAQDTMRVRTEIVVDRGRGGPELTLGTTIGDVMGAATPLYQVDLAGPVGRGVDVRVRYAHLGQPTGSDDVGVQPDLYELPPHLSITSQPFSASLGLNAVALSELTGVTATGTGASAKLNVAGVEPSGFYVEDEASGAANYGGRVGVPFGAAELSISGVHLDDGRGFRQLEAASAGYATPLLGGLFRGEVATRRWENGQGTGLRGEWGRAGERLRWSARAAHTPGGTSAFARAVNEFAANSSLRILDPLQVGVSGWYLEDPGSEERGSLENFGGTGNVTLQPWNPLSISLAAHQYEYQSGGALGLQRAENRGLTARMDVRAGPFRVGLQARESRQARSGAGVSSLAAESNVRSYVAQADLATRLATFRVDALVTRNELGSGLPSERGQVTAAISNVPLVRLGRFAVTGSGSWTRNMTFDAYPDRDAFFVGADVELPGGFRASASGVRDPFFTVSPWMVVLRVEKGISLPAFFEDTDGGTIFRDLNGNGRQDAGEPGTPGVGVTNGVETTVTDDRGRYSLVASGQEPRVDTRTLPMGWVAGRAEQGGEHDFALTPMAPVTVRLVLEVSGADRIDPAELSSVHVMARRADGRTWRGRHTSPEEVVFSALPPGDYELTIDARALSQPLQMRGEAPRFTVAGSELPTIEIPVRGRSIKIKTKPAPGGGG